MIQATNHTFPFFPQTKRNDCGPTCLKIISAFYNYQYEIGFLSKLCRVKNQGTSLFDLLAASNSLGYKSRAALVNLAGLKAGVKLPCICYVNKHFVVIYEINDFVVHIADPACSLKTQPIEMFISDCNSDKKGEKANLLHVLECIPVSGKLLMQIEVPEIHK